MTERENFYNIITAVVNISHISPYIKLQKLVTYNFKELS